MSDKKKTIQEALAEVQRNVELKEMKTINPDRLDPNDPYDDLVQQAKDGRAKRRAETIDHDPPKKPGFFKTMNQARKETSYSNSQAQAKKVGNALGKIQTPKSLVGAGLAAGAAIGAYSLYKNKGEAGKTDAPATTQNTADAPKTDSAANTNAVSTADKSTTSPEPAKTAATRLTFKQAFDNARKEAGGSKGIFSWTNDKGQTKKFQTNIKGEKYLPSKSLKAVGTGSIEAPKEVETPKPTSLQKAEVPDGVPSATTPNTTTAASTFDGAFSPKPMAPAQSLTKSDTVGPNTTSFSEPEKKKTKGSVTVKEAVVAAPPPPQIDPPRIERPAPAKQFNRTVRNVRGSMPSQATSLNARVTTQRAAPARSVSSRFGGQGGSMNAQVQVQRAAPPRAPTSTMPAGQAGSMTAKPTVGSTSFSQGRGNFSKMTDKLDDVSRNMSKGFVPKAVEKAAGAAVGKAASGLLRAASGPAAMAVGAVMEPTPAGEKMSEFERQDTLKKYNPFKSQGRSIDDYEKQQVTRKIASAPTSAEADAPKPEAPKSYPKVDAPLPPSSRPKYFDRGQAFGAARAEAGGGQGKFSYGGKDFQTNIKGEKYSTKLKTTSVKEENEMTDNPLIAAFLKLQEQKASNLFEAAKKAKKDYDKDGKVESEKDEVWGSRFRAAKAAGKMNEASMPKDMEYNYSGSGTVTSTPEKKPKPDKSGQSPVTKDGKPYINPESKKAGMGVREEVEELDEKIGKSTAFEMGAQVLDNIYKNAQRGFSGGSQMGATKNIRPTVTAKGRTYGIGKVNASPGLGSNAGYTAGKVVKSVVEKPGAAVLGATVGGATTALATMDRNKEVGPSTSSFTRDEGPALGPSGRERTNTTPGQGSTANVGTPTGGSITGSENRVKAAAPAASSKPETSGKPLMGTKANYDEFKSVNKNATYGQYLNSIRGLKAKEGGANDPEMIQKKLDSKTRVPNLPKTAWSGNAMAKEEVTFSEAELAHFEAVINTEE